MHIRRPIATLLTALALFGGGATVTGCQAAGQDQSDGTTDTGNNRDTNATQGNLPDNSNEDQGNTDEQNDDSQDPD